ncbi:GntR family transcriptional regulator [Peptoniphilus stercorisuis]|uniref:DNA-binding GntR family transcriptional regulator n=1 Tax=Peptoniphilus stercorisuis TaxID=1436965 RepID=A0ABS4KDS1_9FIRM|nr:GntR family transcriptional regulator [Peptoniphilus stercorisuis]MBP2025917.1 DNA-binding GntR family transcriptional regulator [Peptoniphilus stercorisuis]
MKKKVGLYEEVYDYILEQIFHGKFVYGQKIPEEEISEYLGISRTPIREALRKLESDGLVEILPKRFAQIVTLEDETIKELGIVKLQLDSLTAQLAVFNGSNADFQKLEDINRSLSHAIEKKDLYNVLKKDMEFHKTYTEIGGNNLLTNFQSQIQLKIALLQSVKLKENPELMNHSAYDHKDIIESLYLRDTEKVLQYIIPHISEFYGINADVYSMMIADFSNGRNAIPKGITKIF